MVVVGAGALGVTSPSEGLVDGGSWLDLPAGTGFGLGNLPYGVFSTPGGERRTGVAIGDLVLDL